MANKVLRPTIALFIHETYGAYYQFSIMSGVTDAARDYGVNLVLICGSELNTPRYNFRYANALYQWVGAENADGVILTATLFNYIDQAAQQRFCDGLKPLPIRILGMTQTDSPHIVIDNTNGFRDLLDHLINHHGHRRLAFVRGPEHNADAEERYTVYKDVLAEHGIPLDPALVVQGNFRSKSGEDAVHILWDERQAEVDALVAANDDMALGALNALQSRGVNVPNEVAVAGFDDTDGASAVTPALTTVHQPIYVQAYKSVELLVAQIKGEAVSEIFILPTEAVYRRSCGC